MSHSKIHRMLMFALALGVLLVTLSACDADATHQNIDKWRGTEQGPGKLEKALRNAKLDPDRRGHAAEALVGLGKTAVVTKALNDLSPEQREPVLDKLTPRLWNVAKFTEQDRQPTTPQLRAKDALFELRDLAAGRQKDDIDNYLLDWLTSGGYYEERASSGEHHGYLVVRTLGAKAAPKLVAAGREVLDAPPEKDGRIRPFGAQLLRALAYAGAPNAVGLLLEIGEKPRKQPDLQIDAIDALYHAYILDEEGPKVDPVALRPHVARLQAIAAADDQPGENRNKMHELLAMIPKPDCIPPLAALAGQGKGTGIHLRAVEFGLKCGGVDAVIPLALALPEDDYQDGVLAKYFVKKIPEPQLSKAAEPARALLGDPKASWVAKEVAIEILVAVGDKSDGPRLRALKGEKARLRGWWGDQSDKPKKAQKAEPTLGERALAVAEILEKKQ